MKGDRIAYYEGVKYWLAVLYVTQTRIRPPFDVMTEWIDLTREGLLTIRPATPGTARATRPRTSSASCGPRSSTMPSPT